MEGRRLHPRMIRGTRVINVATIDLLAGTEEKINIALKGGALVRIKVKEARQQIDGIRRRLGAVLG